MKNIYLSLKPEHLFKPNLKIKYKSRENFIKITKILSNLVVC